MKYGQAFKNPRWASSEENKTIDRDRATNAGEGELRGVGKVDSNSKDDMDAFDQFGPKTRAFLNDKMPVKWSSSETLKMMRSRGMNPRDPRVDSMMAQHLDQAAKHISSQLRFEETMAEIVGKILSEEHGDDVKLPKAAGTS